MIQFDSYVSNAFKPPTSHPLENMLSLKLPGIAVPIHWLHHVYRFLSATIDTWMISYSLVQRNDAKKLNEFSSEAIVPILSMKPTVLEWVTPLKLTDISPQKNGYPKRKFIFQASIFRCENVGFRECKPVWSSALKKPSCLRSLWIPQFVSAPAMKLFKVFPEKVQGQENLRGYMKEGLVKQELL